MGVQGLRLTPGMCGCAGVETDSRHVWVCRFEENRGLVMAPETSVIATRFDVFQSAQKFGGRIIKLKLPFANTCIRVQCKTDVKIV